MSVRELPAICYVVVCESCQEAFGAGEGAQIHFESAQGALAEARDADWELAEDGATTCYECIQRRSADDQGDAG